VDAVCREAVKSMVDGPIIFFPPRAPPATGIAEDQIIGASNLGLQPGLSKFRTSGPGTNGKHGRIFTGKVADKHNNFLKVEGDSRKPLADNSTFFTLRYIKNRGIQAIGAGIGPKHAFKCLRTRSNLLA
jgi:hypothetical protein